MTHRRTATGRRHSSTRERLLRELERRAHATTAELVEVTGLHENTVRGHLEQLLADGHIRRELGAPSGRGRPAVRWHAVSADEPEPYAAVARALSAALNASSNDPAAAARSAGRAWGAQLVEEQPDAASGGSGVLIELMRTQGFDPEATDADAGWDETIRLRGCPFMAVAANDSGIVCAVHEGMAAGIAAVSAPTATVGLIPFADAGACLLHLRDAGSPTPSVAADRAASVEP